MLGDIGDRISSGRALKELSSAANQAYGELRPLSQMEGTAFTHNTAIQTRQSRQAPLGGNEVLFRDRLLA